MRVGGFLLLLVLWLLGAAAHAEGCDRAQITETLAAAAADQEAVVAAPGFPSKVGEMNMVIENPEAPENAAVQYHPAARDGWLRMIRYARLLTEAGMVTMESGTFDERDFFDRPFKFTGYRISFEEPAKPLLVAVPAMGRIGLKIGRLRLKDVISIEEVTDDADAAAAVTAGQKLCQVTYTRELGELRPFAVKEVLELTGIEAYAAAPVTLRLRCDSGKCEPQDAEDRRLLHGPLLGF